MVTVLSRVPPVNLADPETTAARAAQALLGHLEALCRVSAKVSVADRITINRPRALMLSLPLASRVLVCHPSKVLCYLQDKATFQIKRWGWAALVLTGPTPPWTRSTASHNSPHNSLLVCPRRVRMTCTIPRSALTPTIRQSMLAAGQVCPCHSSRTIHLRSDCQRLRHQPRSTRPIRNLCPRLGRITLRPSSAKTLR